MKKNIKVLVISDYRSTKVMRPEAEIFIGLKKAGFDIEIMTFGEAEYVKRFKEHGIKIYDYHPTKRYDKKQVAYIRDILIKGQYDILQLFNNRAVINGIRAAKNLDVKVVLYRGFTGHVNWWDPTEYSKCLHPRVDNIICLADSIKEHIGRNLFFDKTKLQTINKGHDLKWYADVQAADLSQFGIPKGSFVVSHASNARPMKGVPYLLESTYYIPKDANIYFLLIGAGHDIKAHQKIIEQSPNADKIILTGYRTDSLSIVKASDVFLLTSLKGEATTKSVIEAMSMGVAPIITDIPGNRDLVIHEKHGLVVPRKNPEKTAEAIMTLYNDRDLVRKYGLAAQKQISENFNTERSIREYAEFYTKIANA